MPGSITESDTNVKYTITNPKWICEWIVSRDISFPVIRSCILKNNIDPLDKNRMEYIQDLLPELFNEVKSVLKSWIQEGYDVKKLVSKENIPSLLKYAEIEMGLNIL